MRARSIGRFFACLAACVALVFSAPVAAVQNPECPADFDCSGTVDVFDLLFLLSQWGQADSIADLTGEGTVDVFDLLALLALWGECVFEYPGVPANTEAWQISLEKLGEDGPLIPPTDIYDRVERDLDLIREAIPELVGKTHVPAWLPNQLIASYPADGENEVVNCLLTTYQGEVVNILFGSMHVIQFAGESNMAAMAKKFADAPETAWAEPDGLIGGDNFWVPTDLGNGFWHWWIDDGWHDCFDGCDCHIFYEVRTDEPGNVTILSIEKVGMPWCVWPN